MADWAAGDWSAAVLGRPRSLPAVAEADAEDTGSAAESADRALHHLRNLGDGRPGLRMRLHRAHVFFRPRLDDATCRRRLHCLGGLRGFNSLLQSSRHYSGTPFERRSNRYVMWRQKDPRFDVPNSKVTVTLWCRSRSKRKSVASSATSVRKMRRIDQCALGATDAPGAA